MEEYFVEEKTSFDRFLDFLVFIAVFVVTIFLILEFVATTGKADLDIITLSQTYYWVDWVVFVIFFVDLVRLRVESLNWSDFFKHYWLDVLATIPFGIIMSYIGPAKDLTFGMTNALKWARAGKLAAATKIQKISRVSKIGKEFKAAAHLKQESDDYQKKNRL